MYPTVKVFYYEPVLGQYHFEDRELQPGYTMDSTDPEAFSLPAETDIMAVFFKFQALETYIQGERKI